MQKLTLILVGMTLSLTAFAAKPEAIRIPLQKEGVAHLLKALPQYKLSPTLQVTGDERTNTLLVQGTPQAIEDLKRIIAVRETSLLKAVKLSMQVVRVRFAEDGTWDMETIASPVMMTMLTDKATLSTDSRDENNNVVQHQGVEITPTWKFLDTKKPNGASVFELKGAFVVQNMSEHFDSVLPVQARVAPGKKLIVGLTDSPDPQVKAAVTSGRFPTDVKIPTTVYYLHITPTFVPEKN